MISLSRPEYDAIEIADNSRRALGKRSAEAAAIATKALWSYLDTVLGGNHAKSLLDLLTDYPDRSLSECLNALGYVVTDPTPEPTGHKCHVVVRDSDECDNAGCVKVVRVFADSDAAAEFSGNTDAGRGTYVLDVDYEPAPDPDDAELLALMLAASETPLTDLGIGDSDLDMLAYDIADTMDKGEFGLGDITSDDIRAVLPAFLRAALANVDANTIVTCDRCGKPGKQLCEECVERRAEL
jgi:hypothetical protein